MFEAQQKAQAAQLTVQLTVEERRDILGEEKLAAPVRSVFDFLAPGSKQKLQSAMKKIETEKSLAEVQREQEQAQNKVISSVTKEVAESALKGFMPFQNDKDKLERYKNFLEFKSGVSSSLQKFPAHYQEREKMHELMEFAKAAQIYRPLSNVMAMRFTSSSVILPPKEGLSNPETEEPKKAVDLDALKSKRTKEKWVPARLVCKRFGVVPPYPEEAAALEARMRDAAAPLGDMELLSKSKMKQLMNAALESQTMFDFERQKRENGESDMTSDTIHSKAASFGRSIKTEKDLEDEKDARLDVKINQERPPIDLFKSIFGDDDDDEESEEEDEKAVVVLHHAASESPSELPNDGKDAVYIKTMFKDIEEENLAVVETDNTVQIPLPKPVFIRKADRDNRFLHVSRTEKSARSTAELIDHIRPSTKTAPSRLSFGLLDIQEDIVIMPSTDKDKVDRLIKRKREEFDRSSEASSSSLSSDSESESASDSDKKKLAKRKRRKERKEKAREKAKDKMKRKKLKKKKKRKSEKKNQIESSGDEPDKDAWIEKEIKPVADKRLRAGAADFF